MTHDSKMVIVIWNGDKPHRCPKCHAVTVTTEKPRQYVVYTCCLCGTNFSSDPYLEKEIVGIACSEMPHLTADETKALKSPVKVGDNVV